MKFKYYDVLSTLLLGYVFLVVLIYVLDIDYDSKLSLAYLSIAYILGYLVNAVSSFLERFYNLTIGGKPSEQLLNKDIIDKKGYSGYWRIKFYEAKECREMLINEVGKSEVKNCELFSRALGNSCSDYNTRVPDFNAQYAFSRSLLTTILLLSIIIIIVNYYDYRSYFIIIVLLICWNRFKERGYYFAKEVLSVYMNKKREVL